VRTLIEQPTGGGNTGRKGSGSTCVPANPGWDTIIAMLNEAPEPLWSSCQRR
jgi:hypothetical protein